jgi:hypothetical protein
VLQEGVDQGVFRSADHVSVLGVLGLFNWTHVWFDASQGPLTPNEVADRLTDVVVYGELVRPQATTPRPDRKATRAAETTAKTTPARSGTPGSA